MPTRQEQLLDAAIDVLGTQGTRALTHRAVDAAAALPAGSAANYFKTRDALVGAVAARFAERDRAAWEAIAGFVRPTDADALAAALTAYVRRALGPERAVTTARYALFVEAALRPELREPLAVSARELRTWAAGWLRAIGSADPERECAAIMDFLDGLILHQLTFPGPPDELVASVSRAVRALSTVS
ncbi:DNA-binding transcriptional regulator YbjK [Catenuloplanes nepalensis]|uniref:DNA-binding transcriptional regulator YbjK n=1 Tax=Catenuloplanes nepalensis TaxID=587533 RepID=A0ABT9MTE3_9ACTN|nr:TetR/AcrR family transcriptional regulator [Catenuloplanes nepalensis]MDP9794653.1 DNA-binding transcriptional regulator YbjK [Catenuloplanes nepalensis]